MTCIGLSKFNYPEKEVSVVSRTRDESLWLVTAAQRHRARRDLPFRSQDAHPHTAIQDLGKTAARIPGADETGSLQVL